MPISREGSIFSSITRRPRRPRTQALNRARSNLHAVRAKLCKTKTGKWQWSVDQENH